jgi:site-specific DNA recombinase
MKAVGYIRVSTEDQAREGYSLPAQKSAIEAYAQAMGWELGEVYADAGRSAKTMRGREELGRLLDAAKAGKFQRIIFMKLDRLARNLKDLLTICDTLEASSVGIVSIKESIDTGTATGRMIRSILGAVSEFEREAIVDRVKTGIAEMAKQGRMLGKLPLGYLRDANGDVVLDPETAPLIREMFMQYATGTCSTWDLSRWARSRGLDLDRFQVHRFLTLPAYAGKVVHNGKVVAQGQHPAIIDEDTFERVQQIRIQRRYRGSPKPFGREPYPLSNIAVCGRCGSHMIGTRNRHRTRYMLCYGVQRLGQSSCEQRLARCDLLEGQVAAYVGGMQFPEAYIDDVVDELRQRRRQPDSGEQAQLRTAIDRWHRLFVLGEIDEDRLRRETSPLRDRLTDLERADNPLDVDRAAGYLRDAGTLWANSPRGLQRQFVREVFERMVVEEHQITEITPKPVYAPLFVADRRERFGGVVVLAAHRGT